MQELYRFFCIFEKKVVILQREKCALNSNK